MKKLNSKVALVILYFVVTATWFFIFEYTFPDKSPEKEYVFLKIHEWFFLILNAFFFGYFLFNRKKTIIKKTTNENNKDRFDFFLDNMKEHCFVFRHGAGADFKFISPSVFNILGVTADEFKLNVKKYNATKLVENTLEKHKKLVSNGLKQPPYDITLKHKNGTDLFFIVHEFPILDSNNEVTGVEGIVQNVTEFKKIEIELNEKEKKYYTLFESANDAILIMKGGIFIDCNQKSLDIFGCTLEQIIMQSPLRYSPVKQADGSISSEIANEKIKLALSGRPQRFRWTHLRYDGIHFEAEVSLNAFKFDNQTYIQAIVRNIDEQAQFEKSLKESENKFRSLTEATVSSILIIQGENFVYTNNAMVDLTGYSREELQSIKFWEIVHPDHQDFVKKNGLGRQNGENVLNHYSFKIIRKTGEEVWLDYTATFIEYNGKPSMLGTAHDITSHIEMANDLRNSKNILVNTFNSLPNMVTVIDRNYNVIISNWKDYLYIKDEYKTGNHKCFECYFERKVPCENCWVHKVIESKQPVEYISINPIDNMTREIKMLPVFGENNQVDFVVEYITNLSIKNSQQSGLKEREKILEELQPVTEDIVFRYNMLENKFSFISDSQKIILGYNDDVISEIKTENYMEYIHPEDFSKLTDNFRNRTGKSQNIKLRIKTSGKDYRPFNITVKSLYKDQKVDSIIGIAKALQN